jgi:hypothetical protein
VSENAIGSKPNNFFCELSHFQRAVIAKTVADPYISSNYPSSLSKPCLEGFGALLHFRIVG